MKKAMFLALLTILSSFQQTHGQETDFQLDQFRFIVRKVTPELVEKLDKLEMKPVRVRLPRECEQGSFEQVCKWDWIETIDLDLSQITDASPIAGMKNLKAVHLKSAGKNFEVDLAVFGKLADLEILDCQAVSVGNTQGLAGLRKLKEVRFYMSDIDSIDFLKETPAVESLNLYGFGHTFDDYRPLLTLKNLKFINIYMNKQATDEKLAVLKELTTIEAIQMGNCRQVTTLDFLENCQSMKRIHAYGANQLSDLSAVAKMTELEGIQLGEVPVKEISFLTGKPKLRYVDLTYTDIADLTPLSEASSLESLSLTNSLVSDLSVLKGKDQLKMLGLSKSKVTDISPLDGLKELAHVSLQETGVTDFSALESCPKLRRVTLPHTATEAQVKVLQEKRPRTTFEVAPRPR